MLVCKKECGYKYQPYNEFQQISINLALMRKAFFILSLILLSVSSLYAQDKKLLPAINGEWKWGNVKPSALLDSLYPKNNFKTAFKSFSTIDSTIIVEQFEPVLNYFEQNGFPFAELGFDSIQTDSLSKTINAKIKFILHDKVLIDSLKVLGEEVIRTNFLISYLGLKPGSVYDERKLKSINNRIDELSFVRLKFPIQVYFVNSKATIVLSPEKRNANKFDGLIGVQPTNTNQKTTIIGQAQLYLVNVLHNGEKLNIDFKSQANNTRDLKLFANYPYVFSTNFGLDVNLELRRQDSSFSNFGRGVGVQYLFIGNNQIRLLYKVDESNLLSTKKYANAVQLPDIIDVKKYSYGINLQLEALDYRINPKKGYSLQITTLLGQRNINKNTGIADSLYNGLKLKSNQVLLMFSLKKFFNLYTKNVLLTSFNTKWINSERLFNNELLRLGGINDLRGFDEESIFASYFWQSTIEYRYILDRNSFLRLFYDQAYFYNSILQAEDYPYGIGAGVQIQTAAGMLQLSYALGAQNNSGINFQTGKIHFGIINYF